MELDTIGKHVGKVYENKILNGEKKSIMRWKYSEECWHVKYIEEYNKFLVRERLRQVEEPSYLNFER